MVIFFIWLNLHSGLCSTHLLFNSSFSFNC